MKPWPPGKVPLTFLSRHPHHYPARSLRRLICVLRLRRRPSAYPFTADGTRWAPDPPKLFWPTRV